MLTTDATQTRTRIVSRTVPNHTLERTKTEVNVPELCIDAEDAEAGLALIPYVNHVGRRDLEALTSNSKLH